MKILPSDFSKSSGLFHNNRSKVRWMEWVIAVLFVVTLLIGSGIFIKASNAADLKKKQHGELLHSEIDTIPGSMRFIARNDGDKEDESPAVIYVESGDSCELKVKS